MTVITKFLFHLTVILCLSLQVKGQSQTDIEKYFKYEQRNVAGYIVDLYDQYSKECYNDSTEIEYMTDCNSRTEVPGSKGMYTVTAINCPWAKKWIHKDHNNLAEFIAWLRKK